MGGVMSIMRGFAQRVQRAWRSCQRHRPRYVTHPRFPRLTNIAQPRHSEIRSLPVRTIIIEVITLALLQLHWLRAVHVCRSHAPPRREISAQRARAGGKFGMPKAPSPL